MSKNIKTVLAVAGIAFVLLVGVLSVLLIYGYWFSQQYAVELEEGRNQGRNFGKTTDNEGCQQESIRQIELVSPISLGPEGIKAQYFFEGCLETSRPSSDFCVNVPTEQEDIWDSDSWKDKRCREFGWQKMNPQCRAVLRARLDFCKKR